MQKLKTFFMFLAAGLFSIFFASFFVAYADSPAPPSYFYSYVTNAGSDVKYTDVLIKIDSNSEYYTDLNAINASAYGFNRSAPIVTYNQDGYISSSFHCKEVQAMPDSYPSDSELEKLIELNHGNETLNTITKTIKIALLDKNGKILKVSDAVSIMPTQNDTFPRSVKYNAMSALPTINFSPYYYGHGTAAFPLLLIVAFLIRMAISTTIETLIAIPFKIRPLRMIIAVNIVTQILLFVFIEFGGLNYINAVMIGEVFVFIFEFAAYSFLFKHISKSKLALYTIVANMASLAAGLIFNYFHIFVA